MLRKEFEILAELRRPAHTPGARRSFQRCSAALVMEDSGLELHLQLLGTIAAGTRVSVEIPITAQNGQQTLARLSGEVKPSSDGIYTLHIGRHSQLLRRRAAAAAS